ncbi:MAG: 30S ribosomal protein S16 [Candidatus Daviesbacteria bacterium]
MAVKIRLMRIGTKKRPFYRVVAVDERQKRTGKYLELLGTYNPLTEPKEIILKKDRIEHWQKQGAILSDGYLRMTKQAPQRPPRKPKKEKKEERPVEKKVEAQEAPEATPEEQKEEVTPETEAENQPIPEEKTTTKEAPESIEQTDNKNTEPTTNNQ